jgi:hypothetical protein
VSHRSDSVCLKGNCELINGRQERLAREQGWRRSVTCRYLGNTFRTDHSAPHALSSYQRNLMRPLENGMEVTTATNRIHQLMAAAAVSLTVVSLVGAAAIAGLLPNSHGAFAVAPTGAVAPNSSLTPQAQQSPMLSASTQNDEYRPAIHNARQRHHAAPRKNAAYETAQAEPTPQYSPSPVSQHAAPVIRNSPLGIGMGALVGG